MLSEEDVEKEYKTFVDENRAALNCDVSISRLCIRKSIL